MSDGDTKFWIYAGGLPYELTEGDIVCVFSQYGEIFEISLSRDRDTGKSRGFCFIKYEDPRSCELAVDNFNGTTIIGRRIKVSFANNTNAVKSRKPAIVAPQQPETSAKPRHRGSSDDRSHDSPRSDDGAVDDSRKRKYRHRSSDSGREIEEHSKRTDLNRDSGDLDRHRDFRHVRRLDDSTYRKDSRDKHRHRDSADRHRNRDSRDEDRPRYSPKEGRRRESPERRSRRESPERGGRRESPERGGRRESPERGGRRESPERGGRRESPERGSRRDSGHNSIHKNKLRESEDKSRHRESERKHRHRESDDKERHRESDHKHRHSRRRSSSDRKSHN